MFSNFIQIAGIIDQAEANMLMQLGVEFLGFPLRLNVNKEDLSESEAAKIISTIHQPHHAVLITYLNSADEIYNFCKTLRVNFVQLHGNISVSEMKKLKNIFPDLKIIKSLVIGEYEFEHLLKIMNELMPFVDAFITDTYNPITGASGATGLTHDWKLSKKICESSSKPVILAGGLTAENVYEAIKFVSPSGVDSHTGVENITGRKDSTLVSRFIFEARRGFSEMNQNQ